VNNVIYRSGGEEQIEYKNSKDETEYKNEPIKTVSRYNPQNDKWQTVANMKQARSGHLMLTGNGVLYVIGGSELSGIVEEYHPNADLWLPCYVSNISSDYTSGTFHNGAIYLCGEYCFQRIVPDPRQKSTAQKLLYPPNSRANSLVSFNGKLLAVGGCLRGKLVQTPYVFEYDVQNNYWIRLPDMEVARKRHDCVVVSF